ncbi:MAG: alpha/beta hydrolase [Oscillospiraceae bacterium]|nr:alpha/beta hydrolase [Oscillospiraceae bacterium]
MKTKQFEVCGIPAILYGKPRKTVALFVHGKLGCKEEAEAFAAMACPAGVQVLAVDLPEHGDRKEMRNAFNPWTVVPELRSVMAYMKTRWNEVSLRANSIGAYFSMLAFGDAVLHKALLVSPILDMEKLIRDTMTWAGVTEAELREKGEIQTDFGETLSWRYLTWVREHPVKRWCWPTAILYAGQDNLTSRETVDTFATAQHAALTVMEHGEHWFHTPEQLQVLAAWERENI